MIESIEKKYQRRAIVGDQHFVELPYPLNIRKPDLWAQPGFEITGIDKNGCRLFFPRKPVSTVQLQALAKRRNEKFRIIEDFTVGRK